MQKALVLTGIVLTAPFLLLTLLSAVVLFNSINPMQLVFVTKFRVENRTAEPLWITPVGTVNSGNKHVLPQFATGFPAFLALRSRDLRVAPGSWIRVLYDWDDINFSEIVVRNAAGEYRQLVVDPDPPKKDYYRNRQDVYVIEDWGSLPATPENVLAAALVPPREPLFWALVVGGVAAAGLFLWLLRIYCRLP